jgi:hypothetical protein
MGDVYRARDTTLERDVALKLLPDAFLADPDRQRHGCVRQLMDRLEDRPQAPVPSDDLAHGRQQTLRPANGDR